MKKNIILLSIIFIFFSSGCMKHYHTFDSTKISPTCEEEGYVQYTCECGSEYREITSPALGHNYTDWYILQEPTENEKGLKEKKCKACSEIKQEEIPIKIHSHKYLSNSFAPTCEEEGYVQYTCECGSEYREITSPALGHEIINTPASEPTCNQIGLTEGKKCLTCDKIIVEQQFIEMKKHSNNINKNENFHIYECKLCGYVETEEHFLVWIIDTMPNEKTLGIKHEECVICNYDTQKKTTFEYTELKFIEETDDKTKKDLLDFNLTYSFNIPGTQLSYNFLWDGYDLENKYGPNVNKDNRLYTFLTEYLPSNNQYYFIYLKKNKINEYKSWTQNYELNYKNNNTNYHFTSFLEEDIIDGKYLLAHQQCSKNLLDDVKIFQSKSLFTAQLFYQEYQLIFCCESKNAIIKENISTSQIINNKITLYRKINLKFDDYNNSDIYFFENQEKYNQLKVDEMFNYVGEALEVYPLNYENLSTGYFPILGMNKSNFKKTIRVIILYKNNKKYLILPRYINNSEKTDLLNDNSNFLLDEDVFSNYKDLFIEAYISEYIIQNDLYIYGIYDYELVKNIIKN